MATTTPAPLLLPAPQLSDGADIEQAVVPLRDRMDAVLKAMVPVGVMAMWLTDTPPLWWLLMNGQDVDATRYPALATVLGSVGGRVILPDLRDRVPLGASATRALKSTGGEAAHVLSTAEMPAHAHGVSDPGHAHMFDRPGSRTAQYGPDPNHATYDGVFYATQPATTGISIQNAGGGGAHNNIQPYLAVNYIIKAE